METLPDNVHWLNSLSTFIVVGSFWFWLLLLVEFLFLCIALQQEWFIRSGVSLLIFFGLLEFCTELDLCELVWYHPIYSISLLIVYLIIGTVWMLFKWRLYVGNTWRETIDYKERFFKETEWKEGQYRKVDRTDADWQKYIAQNKPKAKQHKDRIIGWCSLWPISMLVYFVSDLIIDLFNKIFYAMEGVLNSITDGVWKEVK